MGKLKCSHQFEFNGKYVKSSIFSASLGDIKKYSIKYEIEKTTLIILSKTECLALSLKDVIIVKTAGLFCN